MHLAAAEHAIAVELGLQVGVLGLQPGVLALERGQLRLRFHLGGVRLDRGGGGGRRRGGHLQRLDHARGLGGGRGGEREQRGDCDRANHHDPLPFHRLVGRV
jgi:hypothetical protein